MKVIDQLNRTIHLNKTPKRIISLVPSQTELLVDLGLEEAIVGITKFCIHPVHLRKEKTKVGGTKNVNYEKVKALQPDIILCNKEENTKEMVIELEKIAPVHISEIFTIKDSLQLILQYGELFDIQEKATKIKNELDVLLIDFQNFIQDRTPKKVAYFIWRNPWMVAGGHNFINHLLVLNKFENIYADKLRYPEITLKDRALKENLELILLSSEPYPFKEKHIQELKENNLTAKILLVDGEYFSWYGTRLLKAFDYFKNLHKQLVS